MTTSASATAAMSYIFKLYRRHNEVQPARIQNDLYCKFAIPLAQTKPTFHILDKNDYQQNNSDYNIFLACTPLQTSNSTYLGTT